MRIVIDSAAHSVILREVESEHTFNLYSKPAFDVLSLRWILGFRHASEIVKERELYSRLVTRGSYILAAGGTLEASTDVQGGPPVGVSNQPSATVTEFASRHPQFRQKQPLPPIENDDTSESVSYWPAAWLERLV